MLESDIARELTAGWEVDEAGVAAVVPDAGDTPSADGVEPTETVVARHNDGPGLVLEHVGASPALDATWYVGVERPLEANGWRVQPTTHDAFFDDAGSLCAYINERATAVTDGTERFTAFAIVPHDGSELSLAPGGDPPTPDTVDGAPGFADVFTVRDSALETGATSLETLCEARADLINAVLGDANSLPDALTTVSSPNAAHSETTLEVFTVTDPVAMTDMPAAQSSSM